MHLITPGDGAFVRRDARYLIRWRGDGGAGPLTIDLERDGRRLGSIARHVSAASGQYGWQVGRVLGRQLRDGGGYRIVLRGARRNLLARSEGAFSIVSPGYRVRPGSGAPNTAPVEREAAGRGRVSAPQPRAPGRGFAPAGGVARLATPATPQPGAQESAPPLALLSPAPYEGWCTGEAHTVRWSSTLPPATPLRIDLVKPMAGGPQVWMTLSENTPNDGSFEWPGIAEADFNSVDLGLKVRIATLDSTHEVIGDHFSFGKPLYLEQPDAAHTWRHGANVQIGWDLICPQAQPLSIDLLDADRQPYMNIASGLSAQPRASTNKRFTHSWQVPQSVDPGSYYVRLSSGT
ncbi:MAG: hypothetical protein B0D86_06090, partial [Candidatus Sedimenticola endophacoides]